jgi:hypothetical protein
MKYEDEEQYSFITYMSVSAVVLALIAFSFIVRVAG